MPFSRAMDTFVGWSLKRQFDFIEKSIGNQLPANFEAEYRQYSFQLFEQMVEPMPGAVDFLKNLTVPYCVASNGPLQKMAVTLKKSGLAQYFDSNIFSAYQIGKFKPEPDLFEFAAREMGFPSNNCLVIDDSEAGVQAALAGGFPIVHFGLRKFPISETVPAAESFAALRTLMSKRLFAEP